jgi:N-acetyl-D-muramate 6-phosphate phosphatase
LGDEGQSLQASVTSFPQAILFDFDGTLVDSAPDLAGAVNDLRIEHGLEPLAYETLRPFATYGARSLLKAGLDMTPEHDEYEKNRQRFLAIYGERKLHNARLFGGVLETLIAIERRGLRWGIVTNKNSRLAEPMIDALLRDRAFNPAVVVCGDHTPTPKPHPLPLTTAADAMNVAPTNCWYIGDGENDVRASLACAMPCVLAAYGYISDLAHARTWGATHEIDEPIELVRLLPRLPMDSVHAVSEAVR